MFIQTEGTPNPATLKFLPGCRVMAKGTADFPASDQAGRSPLAGRLFDIEGVAGVFLGDDFITVTKDDDKDWEAIKPFILGAVMDHFTSGEPVIVGEVEDQPGGGDGDGDEDDEVVARIKDLLDTRVRPAVAQDGGDIVFHGFEDGIVLLTMQGACSGCPSSSATLQHGIENLLRHYVPEVLGVRAVE